MVDFPRIKKEFTDFVSDEDGRISQSSLIKMGVLSVGFLSFAYQAEAASGSGSIPSDVGRVTYVCDDTDDKDLSIAVTCHDVIEAGGPGHDVTINIALPQGSGDDMDMTMAMMDCDDARKKIGNWLANEWGELENTDGFKHFNVTVSEPWKGSNPFPREGRFDLDYHQHENSLAVDFIESSLSGTHEHAVYSDCTDIKVTFEASASCSGDAHATFHLKLFDGSTQLCDVDYTHYRD